MLPRQTRSYPPSTGMNESCCSAISKLRSLLSLRWTKANPASFPDCLSASQRTTAWRITLHKMIYNITWQNYIRVFNVCLAYLCKGSCKLRADLLCTISYKYTIKNVYSDLTIIINHLSNSIHVLFLKIKVGILMERPRDRLGTLRGKSAELMPRCRPDEFAVAKFALCKFNSCALMSWIARKQSRLTSEEKIVSNPELWRVSTSVSSCSNQLIQRMCAYPDACFIYLYRISYLII